MAILDLISHVHLPSFVNKLAVSSFYLILALFIVILLCLFPSISNFHFPIRIVLLYIIPFIIIIFYFIFHSAFILLHFLFPHFFYIPKNTLLIPSYHFFTVLLTLSSTNIRVHRET